MRKLTCASEGVEDILELPARASLHSVVKKAWFKNAAGSQGFSLMSFPFRKQFELSCVVSYLAFFFFLFLKILFCLYFLSSVVIWV